MQKRVTTLLASALLMVVVVPIAAQAHSEKGEVAQTAAQERRETAQANATDRQEAGQARLADAKLKACQKREQKINATMARMAERGTRHIAVFTKISERTQAFYTKKGRTLSNYDALVTEVEAKKAEAEAAVKATKDTSVSFACDGTDPKGVAASFKENLKAQNEALKAYKTAVKNLIVGVKSVQGTTSSSKTNEDKPASTEGGE
jgi:hypothetical protein